LAYEMIGAGELGQIHQARFRYSQQWRADPDAPLPSPSGALNIIGCHAVDQARFLVGEIGRVSAMFTNPVTTPERLFGDRPVEQDDTVTMAVEFAGGIPGTIDASLVSAGRKNMLSWEINGSKGSLAWDLEHLNVLRVYRANGGRTQGFTEVLVTEADHTLAAPWWPSAHILGWEHGHINMLAHFLDAVANDGPVAPHAATFADGARAALIAESAWESASSGRWVDVPATVPADTA
jgi:predicted dehydrogenase